MIGRRVLLGASVIGASFIASSTAEACSIIATPKAKSFKASVCEQQIYDLVAFLNKAPSLSRVEIEKWVDDRGVDVYYEYPLSQNVGGVLYNYLFFQEYHISGGKPDPKPMQVSDVNLIRQVKNQAAYQFTIDRTQFFPADEEGCKGLFTHDEYFGATKTAFIAKFLNNKMTDFREFPEWFV